MKVLTAHRIVIGVAAAFFVFYGGWEIRRGRAGAIGGTWRGGVALLAAVALLVYFRTLFRSGIDPEGRSDDQAL